MYAHMRTTITLSSLVMFQLSTSSMLLAMMMMTMMMMSHCVESRFVVEKSSISILSPYDLKSKHDAAIANFGVPDYGGSMVGTLMYPDKGSTGCSAFNGDLPFKSKSSRPTILLLDRGECYFALKVWYGQQAGAAAVLVADIVDEPLITMDTPEESSDADGYIEKINIPSALIERSFAESLKEALKRSGRPGEVVVKIDWTESMPHPDQRVEYELWTNSNDECGARCDEQMSFVKEFKGHAQILEKAGYTQFTPHYITWYCPRDFVSSNQCKSQCINHGRYCAPDPEQDFSQGYQGKDVVFENLRQLCVHRVANQTNRSWVWWDYVSDFHIRCSMKQKRYSKECAEQVMESLGLPIDEINNCIGDPEADRENEVLRTEQDLQVGHGSRGDITILPTMVINNVQYRGKLERTAVLRAICAGFKETTDPPLCLSSDLETNECMKNNGGCWEDPQSNVTACKDTFRGRVCECPLVSGIQYRGDGYTSCEAVGPGRCSINNGGCWSDARDGVKFSACAGSNLSGCQCPPGFKGDGYKCEDIDECKEGLSCQCEGCSCNNKWGGFECSCMGNKLYIMEHDTCIERSHTKLGGLLALVVLAVVATAGAVGFVFYKYRLRSYMDAEIMAIMSQYMPLEGHQNQLVHHDQPEQPLTRDNTSSV